MTRALIVNADDFNLTRGVDRAILDCHDSGIVSSTTFMANLPIEVRTVSDLKKRKKLGVGIHLNVTFQRPLSPAWKIRSLLREDSSFKKMGDQLARLPKASELAIEYAAQIERFVSAFGRKPTHLDTHHQMHNHPFFLDVIYETGKKFRLPIRSSCLMLQSKYAKFKKQSITSFFFGSLLPQDHWTMGPLENLLRHIPQGISEVMCHPGIVDADLKAVSSFTTGRAVEHQVLSSPRLRKLLEDQGVVLRHYGV